MIDIVLYYKKYYKMYALQTYPFQHFPKYIDTKGIKEKVLNQVTLGSDKILIGRGTELVEVEERRKTAWLSNNSKLTFTYSGKTMSPRPIPKFMELIRLKLVEEFGIDFDGILVNYYENGNSSMGYHSDPIDNKWSNQFVIISIGAQRDFIFRNREDKNLKISYDFQDGDLIYMFDNCQEQYEHCVKKCKADYNDRVSLVFKKSLT